AHLAEPVGLVLVVLMRMVLRPQRQAVLADVDLQAQVLVELPQSTQVAAFEDHRQLAVRCLANHLAVVHLRVPAVHRTTPDTFYGMLRSAVAHRDNLGYSHCSLVCDHSYAAILLVVLFLVWVARPEDWLDLEELVHVALAAELAAS
ncbi:unnamed protein product, partial [Effrenium voratum]